MEQGDRLLAWKEQLASRLDEAPSLFGPSLSALSHGLSQMASLGASGSLGNMNSCACKATRALLCDCVCHCTECKTTCGLQGAASVSPLLPVETLSSHHGLRYPGLLTALTVAVTPGAPHSAHSEAGLVEATRRKGQGPHTVDTLVLWSSWVGPWHFSGSLP